MTELMWEGKYKDGKRVAPVRILLPFQTVETVNESAQVRAHALDLWTQGQPSEWRNRLIWGDKKYVLPSLLSEFAGKVNLIYIDPPFATGADFSFTTTIPESDESFTKEPSMIEQKAYRDTWGRGLDGYLQWFYETVALLRDLLAEDGSIYVHLDTTVAHYVKAVLDEVFGHDNFVNEIVWKRYGAHNDIGQGSEHYGRVHDTIFFYRKGENTTWAQIFTPLDSAYVENTYRYTDPDTGRKFRVSPVTGPGGAAKGNPVFEWNGHTRAWRYGRETMERLHKEGRLYYSRTGYVGQKLYLDESKGTPVQDIWTDVSSLSGAHAERIGYPTQKPEPLLERILKASSNEGDLVLDCFCGSGTTAAVAEKLGLRWITCDLGRFAIHTARKRLLSIPNVKPFVVQNLGKYERQAWQVAEFAEGDKKQSPAVQLAYRRFMLDLYRAQPLDGYVWLHGVRDGRLVHVGSVDAPVAVGDVQQIVKEVWKVGAGPHPLPLSARGEGGPCGTRSDNERRGRRSLPPGSLSP